MNFLRKNFLYFLGLILILLPLIIPFLKPGFFISHDGEWAVIRLTAFNFALRDGQLPPRWAGNLFHGYGYPVLNFNYPLPYIIGEAFHLIGFNFVDSIKLVFILSVIFSAIFIFLLVTDIFDKKTGFFASILYLYYPFRMVDLFVRGSVGESLAFAILPLVYWSLLRLKRKKSKQRISLVATSVALLILAHNSVAFISLPFVLLFLLFNFLQEKKKQKTLPFYFLALFLGLGLSAFFWLPALYEKRFTILQPGIITDPTTHFPPFKELILPVWRKEAVSFQLGPAHLFLFLTSTFFLLKKKHWLVWFFVGIFLFNLFLLTPFSKIFWQLPLMVYLSYPWRILVPLGFYLSVIGSFSFFQIKKQSLKGVLLVFSFLLLFITTLHYREPVAYINRDEGFYITNQSTTIQGDENTPVWVKEPPTHQAEEKVELAVGEYQILKQKSNYLKFSVKTPQETQAIINTIYYPGWQVFVNGEKKEIDYQGEVMGRLVFSLPAGSSEVEAVFKETSLRLMADLVSLISLGIIVIGTFLRLADFQCSKDKLC